MTETTGIVKAGMVLNFSSGQYSDYGVFATMVATQDFNYNEEAKKFYFELRERESEVYSWSLNQMFISYLIKKELVVSCNCLEIHTGDYDFFDKEEWDDELGINDE